MASSATLRASLAARFPHIERDKTRAVMAEIRPHANDNVQLVGQSGPMRSPPSSIECQLMVSLSPCTIGHDLLADVLQVDNSSR